MTRLRMPPGFLAILLLTVLHREEIAWASPSNPPAVAAPRSYEEVIPKQAVSTRGLFTVHRVKDRIYYEIPPARLGADMLWYTEIAKVPAAVNCGATAMGTQSVRWERVHDRVLLRVLSFDKRADVDDIDAPPAILRAVEDASLPPIVMAFDVEAEGKDGAPVIDVTRLLVSNVEEFSAERLFTQAGISVRGSDGRANVDPARCYVDEIKVFPKNIEARAVITFKTAPVALGNGAPARLPSASLLVHYSMTLLPEEPMRPRFFDPRVGFFSESYEDYSKGDKKVVTRRYINRFRLEKRDPAAPISDPVKPIVFYIGREVPEKWHPYLKQAVEDWQPAFEAAGFRNAIVVREAPTEQEDPSWDAEDTRYSAIRWGASPIANAFGPNMHDPRSGEILSANVVIYQDILRLAVQWYFSMCAASDPRARKFPFPDDLKGEILRYIVAHEVGHTLGLRHNHKASSAFTVEQLRDPSFTARYGTVASIMSYGRFNYVAQPGDGVVQRMPKIGPYDVFAIQWGYEPLPETSSAEEEKPLLDRLAARQIENPWLRFGGEDGPAQVDPSVKVQSIGSDPVQSTQLGLRNLERTFDLLLPATTRLGEDFADLREAYNALLDTRQAWLVTVANVIGGVEEHRTLGGRGGDQFVRISRVKQREALTFLLEAGFGSPNTLVRPDVLNKFRYLGVSEPVMQRQRRLLQELLSEKRYKLLKDAETLDPVGGYTLAAFLADVQNVLFSEFESKHPFADIFRRELHRYYLTHLKAQFPAYASQPQRRSLVEADQAAGDFLVSSSVTDFRAVARNSLERLSMMLLGAMPKIKDGMTRVHVEDCLREIGAILGTEAGANIPGAAPSSTETRCSERGLPGATSRSP